MAVNSSEHWIEMASDAIKAASARTSTADYERSCRLAPTSAGLTYFDRTRVAEELIKVEAIRVENGRLVLGELARCDEIFDRAKAGNVQTWKLLDDLGFQESFERKFDSDELKHIGETGEMFIISSLYERLPSEHHRRVLHVAAKDDTAGYDILAPSVTDLDEIVLLEVKTSVRQGREFVCYVSANEVQTGIRNANWRLMLVRISDNEPQIMGHLSVKDIEDRLPLNVDKSCNWQTARLAIDLRELQPGLP